MTFKTITGVVHLWLGIASGLIVFIISVTGCLYAFKTEIENATQEYRFVEPQSKAYLLPSELLRIASTELPNKHEHAVQYGKPDEAARVIYYNESPLYYYNVFINPYDGNVLHTKDMLHNDFFAFVLDGHFRLWLPNDIGQPIVASATLIFVVMLISGIILWWPKNKAATKQRFWFRWKNGLTWKRKNYDLHNIAGFYASWVAIVLALTGLIWGFQWFAGNVYFIASGGEIRQFTEATSDTTAIPAFRSKPAIDILFEKTVRQHPQAAIEVHAPENSKSAINIAVNYESGTYWKTDYINYDQYTLQEVPGDKAYGRYDQASTADLIFRMNYDIHVGAIFGIAGKILMFFISLICASLPITGFYIWWGRRRNNKLNTKSRRHNVREVLNLNV